MEVVRLGERGQNRTDSRDDIDVLQHERRVSFARAPKIIVELTGLLPAMKMEPVGAMGQLGSRIEARRDSPSARSVAVLWYMRGMVDEGRLVSKRDPAGALGS